MRNWQASIVMRMECHKQRIMNLLNEPKFSFILARMPRLGAKKGDRSLISANFDWENFSPNFRAKRKIKGSKVSSNT